MRLLGAAAGVLVSALVSALGAGVAHAQDAARADAIDFPEARAPVTARLPQDGSDLNQDPAVRTGILGNGMRYVVERRTVPAASISVRLRLAVGAVHEADGQEGYAHLVEHMHFNGSAAIPEGEMAARLERLGAAFGRDVNAIVTDTETVFRFDFPSGDGRALDEVLRIARETASRLTIAPEALEREKAVVLAEIMQASTTARIARDAVERAITPHDLATRRRAVGEPGPVSAATVARITEFYRTWYRPERAILVVVGDVDPAATETAIRERFADWRAAAGARPQAPDNGRWPDASQTRVVIAPEPVLEPSLTIRFLHAEEVERGRLDTVARQAWWSRTRTLERMVQARLDRAVAASSAGLRDARVLFTRAANGWELRLTGRPSGADVWPQGLDLLATELKAAVDLGFSADELEAARLAQDATLVEAVAAAPTRPAPARADQLLGEMARVEVSISPADRLAQFRQASTTWTPADLQQALAGWSRGVRPVIVLAGPLGAVPEDQARVRAQWDSAWTRPLPVAVAGRPAWTRPRFTPPVTGPAGALAGRAERTSPRPHTVARFANGVSVAVLPTPFARGQVEIAVTASGGALTLPARAQGLAAMSEGAWQDGSVAGLEASDLRAALAGTGARSGTVDIGALDVRLGAVVPSAALESQLQVLLAQMVAPGLEAHGAQAAAQRVGQGLPVAAASPEGVLRLQSGRLFLRGSPRFAAPDPAVLTDTSPERLATGTVALRSSLQAAPVTVTIVGDVGVDAALAAAGRTFGTLAPRDPAAGQPDWREVRNWRPARPGRVRLTHTGAETQALLHLSFATPGDRDVRAARALTVLAGVIQLRLTARIREAEGLSYTPSAAWAVISPAADHGRLWIQVSTRPEAMARAASLVEEILADLRQRPPSADELTRARQPLIEARLRSRQTNGFWVSRLARTNLPQPPGLEGPGLMELDASYEADLLALDGPALQALARRYLLPRRAVRVEVWPRNIGTDPAG